MSRHNYSQYSNKKNENKVDITPEVKEEIQNGVETAVTEEVEAPIVETTVTEEVETPVVKTEAPVTETETNSGAVATGVVAKCAKLNVRSKPSTNGDVVTVLNAGDKISIDADKSTDEWLKIRTNDGIKGYCMKKFVSANI